MPVGNQIEVVGVKDALRELNDIDKKLRRQIIKDYQEIVAPVVNTAKTLTPREAPLSGFARSWSPAGSNYQVLPYSGARLASRPPRVPGRWQQSKEGRRQMGKWLQWNAQIRAYVSGKRPRTVGGYTRNLAAFGTRWQGPAAVLFDTSGQPSTPQGARMVAALNSKYGRPSRVMWRAYERESLDVQAEMRELVNKIMRSVDRQVKI